MTCRSQISRLRLPRAQKRAITSELFRLTALSGTSAGTVCKSSSRQLNESYPGVDGLIEKCCEVNLCGGVGMRHQITVQHDLRNSRIPPGLLENKTLAARDKSTSKCTFTLCKMQTCARLAGTCSFTHRRRGKMLN
jgi:hypothetical protein